LAILFGGPQNGPSPFGEVGHKRPPPTSFAKHAGADGDFAGEEFEPLADVEGGKKNAEEYNGLEEAHGLRLVDERFDRAEDLGLTKKP
jgi:hypothetical protein